MKNKRPVQILTIVLAMTMLAAYVVYSQRQRSGGQESRPVTIRAGKESLDTEPLRVTNTLQSHSPLTVAPGSKSMAPLVDVRPVPPGAAAQGLGRPESAFEIRKFDLMSSGPAQALAPKSRRTMIASGSKSGPVFNSLDLMPSGNTAQSPASKSRSIMIAPGSRSAAVFDLREQQQAQKPKLAPAPVGLRGATNATVTIKR